MCRCAESRAEAQDRAIKWLGKKWQSIDNHYHFSDGHLATVKGYETYGKMAQDLRQDESERDRDRATDFYVIDPDRRHARGLHRARSPNCSG